MLKSCCLFILIICTTLVQGQSFHEKEIEPRQDTIKKKELLKSIGNPKHQLIISILYGSGLRVSEVCNIKIKDLD